MIKRKPIEVSNVGVLRAQVFLLGIGQTWFV